MLKAAILLALLLPACMPSDQPPDTTIPPPPDSCGDNRCEPSSGENNVNCPGDCPDCYAVYAIASDTQQVLDDACGKPDGKMATASGEVYLTIGRDMVLGGHGKFDLELIGEVTGPAASPDLCSVTGGVQVLVSADQRTWKLIGTWAPGANQFSLSCTTQLNSAHFVLLRTLGATLKLDAAHGLSCFDGNTP